MRIDLGETENDFVQKAKEATSALLARLIEHHNHNTAHVPEAYVKPSAPPPLPPISKELFTEAYNMAYPGFVLAGTIKSIMRQTAMEFAPVTVLDLMSQRRTKKVAEARQVAMYLAKEMTARSLPEIGRRFNRDHTTVLHAVRTIRGRMVNDPVLSSAVDRIVSRVEVVT